METLSWLQLPLLPLFVAVFVTNRNCGSSRVMQKYGLVAEPDPVIRSDCLSVAAFT